MFYVYKLLYIVCYIPMDLYPLCGRVIGTYVSVRDVTDSISMQSPRFNQSGNHTRTIFDTPVYAKAVLY